MVIEADVPAEVEPVVVVLLWYALLRVGKVETVELELGLGPPETSTTCAVLVEGSGIEDGAVGTIYEIVGKVRAVVEGKLAPLDVN